MKRTFLWATAILFFAFPIDAFETILPSTQSPRVTVVFPREGAKIPYVKRSFVYGNVKPATAQLKINGKDVSVYRTGSFVGITDFQPGSFPIYIEGQHGEAGPQVVRTVIVSSPTLPIPEGVFAIDLESLEPSQDRVVIAGDLLTFRLRASPACRAEYRLLKKSVKPKESDWKKMQENPGALGSVYQAMEELKPFDKEEEFHVEYRVAHPSKGKKFARSPGKIKVIPGKIWGVALTAGEESIVRTGPSVGGDSMGYDLFLPEGVSLAVDGQIGSEARVYLSPTLRGWIPRSSLKEIEPNFASPKAILSSFQAKSEFGRLSINFALSSRVPYKATLSEDLKSFKITFFYTVSNLDRMRYDAKGYLREARWCQSEEKSAEISCRLSQKVWGYNIMYEGNQCVVDFKFFGENSPNKRKKKKKLLAGLKIAVDAGHSSRLGDGTISPQGRLEGDYTLSLATLLKEILQKAGATVLLTRENGKSIELEERKKIAVANGADLFVSLHANAVGYSANPLEHRGFSLFYFTPQSLELARNLSASMAKSLPLPEDGLYYGNFSVCRMTQMPSVLIETGYLIHPEDEELLLDEKFQLRICEAIFDGVQQFVKEWKIRDSSLFGVK